MISYIDKLRRKSHIDKFGGKNKELQVRKDVTRCDVRNMQASQSFALMVNHE